MEFRKQFGIQLVNTYSGLARTYRCLLCMNKPSKDIKRQEKSIKFYIISQPSFKKGTETESMTPSSGLRSKYMFSKIDTCK